MLKFQCISPKKVLNPFRGSMNVPLVIIALSCSSHLFVLPPSGVPPALPEWQNHFPASSGSELLKLLICVIPKQPGNTMQLVTFLSLWRRCAKLLTNISNTGINMAYTDVCFVMPVMVILSSVCCYGVGAWGWQSSQNLFIIERDWDEQRIFPKLGNSSQTYPGSWTFARSL